MVGWTISRHFLTYAVTRTKNAVRHEKKGNNAFFLECRTGAL